MGGSTVAIVQIMQYDVFISYSSEEQKIAERLAAYLEYYNINCFVASRDIPADMPWSQAIAEAIRGSRMALVVYSENYNNATWLNDELATVRDASLPIYVFAITNEPYCETKSVYLKNASCIGAVGDFDDAYPFLYEEICNMLGMPIEQTKPVCEVVKSEEPVVENVAPAEPQPASPKKVEEPTAKIEPTATKEMRKPSQASSLLTAAAIGISITAIMIALLEWALR